MKKIYFALFICLFINEAIGQNIEPCGQVDYMDAIERQYPGFKVAQERQYQEAILNSQSKKLNKIGPGDTIFHIPVVFHIVYKNAIENLHDSFIISQVKVLNECYRKKNADTVNTRDIFKPIAGDAGIEFYLATTDPQGNSTNGITRTSTTKTSFYSTNYSDEMKFTASGGSDAWDPTKYLNIWVCNISQPGGTDILLGYAFPPTNAQFWSTQSFVPVDRQGVVLSYEIVGLGNQLLNLSNSSREKTAVHEVGHYLGLRHTWGDGNVTFGCNFDDGILDTPNSRTKHSGCNKALNTCGAGTAGDLPDQAENYMDYSNGICTNMFTQQQVNLMRSNLSNLRTSLPDKEVIPLPKEIVINALFPNPSNGQFTLEVKGANLDEIYKIEVVDILGQVVFSFKTKLTSINQLDLIGLTNGVYNFQLKNASNKVFFKEKIIVVRN
jgi:hypothetical protein